MAFSPRQLRFINAVRRRISGLADDDIWRFVLRQTGCARGPDGVPKLTHERNNNSAFESIMLHLAGYPESGLDESEWIAKAEQSAKRLQHAIESFAHECEDRQLVYRGALGPFIERMTSRRPQYSPRSKPTDRLEDCTLAELVIIAEGLKAWMYRTAKNRKLPCPQFAGKRGAA